MLSIKEEEGTYLVNGGCEYHMKICKYQKLQQIGSGGGTNSLCQTFFGEIDARSRPLEKRRPPSWRCSGARWCGQQLILSEAATVSKVD
ncbi:hypothetical protein U1Q18_044499 [Sarracenia purpurea var. burkii]